MVDSRHTGIFTPLTRELEMLYGQYIPEDDVYDIKLLIRKYFTEKYKGHEEFNFAEIGVTREDFGTWVHDPEK